MKMTNEFRIDRPGVYRMRNGRRVYVWPLMISRKFWIGEEDHGCEISSSEVYFANGRLLEDRQGQYDIVAYAGPLPADILQRMLDALAAAEYQPHQATPATFGEVLKAMAEEQPQ
jgi:hypothetical protein